MVLHTVNYQVLSSLDMLNVDDRVRQLRLNHIYNIYHGSAPSYLHANVPLISALSVRNIRTSSNEDFFYTSCQADIFYYNDINAGFFIILY